MTPEALVENDGVRENRFVENSVWYAPLSLQKELSMRIATVMIAVFLACALGTPLQAVSAEPDAESETQPEAESKVEPGAEKSADSKEETVVTKSGLEYTELKAGTGESPKRTNVVEVHYHGTFEDGSVFDSSVDRGKPATFPLTRVIRCWTEGVTMMRVGGKSRLVCPPNIAYGARGMPPRIPPNATLTFEVELLRIVK
jgi:FKBP-type peptidyl-prolyl cis-trans isomerase